MATESLKSTKPGDAKFKPKTVAAPVVGGAVTAKNAVTKIRGTGAATKGLMARGPMA